MQITLKKGQNVILRSEMYMDVLNNAKKTSEVNDTTYGISVCPRDVGFPRNIRKQQ